MNEESGVFKQTLVRLTLGLLAECLLWMQLLVKQLPAQQVPCCKVSVSKSEE